MRGNLPNHREASSCQLKPGDIVKWVWVDKRGPPRLPGESVGEGEEYDIDEDLWSTVDRNWVPIHSELVHVLINVGYRKRYSDGRNWIVVTWLNVRGVFSAVEFDWADGNIVLKKCNML